MILSAIECTNRQFLLNLRPVWLRANNKSECNHGRLQIKGIIIVIPREISRRNAILLKFLGVSIRRTVGWFSYFSYHKNYFNWASNMKKYTRWQCLSITHSEHRIYGTGVRYILEDTPWRTYMYLYTKSWLSSCTAFT